MEIKDFLVTPLYLILIYFTLYIVRPYVTNKIDRRYFIPAITAKFLGALAIAIVYQFYYGGGDTFGYTTYGSSHIYNAFLDSPISALRLIFADATYNTSAYKYALQILYFGDSSSYFVVRVAGVLSLISFDTYSTIALFFALFGFSGLWAMYKTFVRLFPTLHMQLAIAIFAIPSVVFWGSGVMKDTLTLSAVGWMVYASFELFFFRQNIARSLIIILLSIWVIYIIKIYILFCIIPSLCVFGFWNVLKSIKSSILRFLLRPIIAAVAITVGFFASYQIGQSNKKYSLENILQTAEITAKDNSLWTVRKEGSGYNLGDYDFSPAGLARKFIPAVWVTLYRPYLWEINSPLMLLSALESLALAVFTVYLIWVSGLFSFVRLVLTEPIVSFCFIFSVSFAFAVGISSGNFGSLVRYKIPIMPFFLIGLLISYNLKRTQQKKISGEQTQKIIGI